MTSGKIVSQFSDSSRDAIHKVDFVPKRKEITSTVESNRFGFWKEGADLPSNLEFKSGSPISNFSMSGDGSLLALGLDYDNFEPALRLWDVTNQAWLREFPRTGHGVESLSLSVDGSWLAASATEGVLQIWETKTGAELYRFEAVPHNDANASLPLEFSADIEISPFTA